MERRPRFRSPQVFSNRLQEFRPAFPVSLDRTVNDPRSDRILMPLREWRLRELLVPAATTVGSTFSQRPHERPHSLHRPICPTKGN
jgi:hypothetical protein